VQSVPITTDVVSSNPADGEVHSIQHYVIKFVSDFTSTHLNYALIVTNIGTLRIAYDYIEWA